MALTEKLTAIADAIRAKTGGTDKLTLDEMANAIGGISAGGSGGGDIDALIDGSITEVASDAKGIIRSYFFDQCTSLTSVNLPSVTRVMDNGFSRCSSLRDISIPLVTEIRSAAFYGCSSLVSVVFPSVTNIGSSAFSFCDNLESVDLPSVTRIEDCAFEFCDKLKNVILRSETMCVLKGADVFYNCYPFIYVPSSLVDTYKAATNWSAFADRFRALEDYTVDGTITGELDETKI